ncbi:unnamed protein product [Paramecium octaurelia]|uniref:4-alpha-hydroxy-tetrahydropterin dehydratase n=1 Tax=Paramecium octaurelia TaxID=43137 RepID=A0A8S1UEE9_PAROT|nr:unnamed protein product [Paramecium octaurelia]CAD8162354.1 unnamed protein product [Paramecium octaurelia]
MYRNLTSNNTRTTANLLGLKYLLKDFSDVPTKKFTKLSADEVNQILSIHELNSNWTFNVSSLGRKYQFQNFQDSFSFMAQVSQIAEEMKHYPKWYNKNGLVTIDLTTNEVKGVTFKDVLLAYTSDHISQIIQQNHSNSIFDNCNIHVENLIQQWNHNYQKGQELNQVIDKSVNFL